MKLLTFSESNTKIKIKYDNVLDSWIFNIYEQLLSNDPDWDIIKINLGDTEEDEEECNILLKIYKENPKEALCIYREILDEELEQEAQSFIFKKIAENNNMYSRVQIEKEIIGNDNLEETKYGPINAPLRSNLGGSLKNFSPEIVDQAIEYSSQIVPQLKDKDILAGFGNAYGVVETELQRKIAKRKILDELKTMSDPMPEDQFQYIVKRLDEEMKKSHAIRINIEKIELTMANILSKVKENVISAGLQDILNHIEIQASIIALGSVIAHEGEHATVMTGGRAYIENGKIVIVEGEGDPRGESSAENIERNFIEQILQRPEFECVKPFLKHDQQSVSDSEMQQIIEKLRNELKNNNQIQSVEKASENKKSWYKI